MADPSNILNTFLHDLEVNNLKILFYLSFNIQTIDDKLLNKYVIYKFYQYKVVNTEDYNL